MMVTLSFLLPGDQVSFGALLSRLLLPSIEFALVSCAQSSSNALGIEVQLSPVLSLR